MKRTTGSPVRGPADARSSEAAGHRSRPHRRTPNSTVHVMQALESLASDPRGVTAKAVARRSGQSLSSAYYLLQALSSLGFVERSSVSHGLYMLGPKIAELFRGYVASWRLPERLDPILQELRDRARARAYAAAWNDSDLEVVCVRGRRGASELHDVSAGFRGAAHALALGKVLLAPLPPRCWPPYLQGERFPAYTEHTVTTPQGLYEELAAVRRSGHAVDAEEFEANVCCLAAPIRDTAGRVLGTVGVSVPTRRFRRDREKLQAAVAEVAAAASAEFQTLDPLSAFVHSCRSSSH